MIATHEWGERGSPLVVCLHGVTSHGRHFAPLAKTLADRFHVIALDLRGHGDSLREPPWNIEQHVDDVIDALQLAGLADEPCRWIGHSFGGRIAFEVAAAAPELVERLVLLDPAIHIQPPVGLYAADRSRVDRSYASFEEAIDRRFEESALKHAPRELLELELREHLFEDEDGRWRYRFSQSAVVAAYGEMSREPPPFELVLVPTLLVLGEESYIPYDDLLDAHVAALGDELEVVRVPGGHTVLWDALAETAAAVERFLR
ncbi:MAG: alpha/beta fold hydrolase [Actinobacteria bacterium]|nr:alpha/beta fold hydrolase [Actinomycetota bacterium]